MVDSWDATHPGQARVSKGRTLEGEHPKKWEKDSKCNLAYICLANVFGGYDDFIYQEALKITKQKSEPEILTSTQILHLLKNKILIRLTHIAMVLRLWSWALGKMVLWEASKPAIVMSSRVPWPRGGSKVGYKGHTIDKACQSHSETSPGLPQMSCHFSNCSSLWIAIQLTTGSHAQTMSSSHFTSFFANSEVTLR